jgi:hypothetical protein
VDLCKRALPRDLRGEFRDLLKPGGAPLDEFASRKSASIKEIARREGVYNSDVKRLVPLAFLAPEIVRSICNGSQPPNLTAEALNRKCFSKRYGSAALPRGRRRSRNSFTMTRDEGPGADQVSRKDSRSTKL